MVGERYSTVHILLNLSATHVRGILLVRLQAKACWYYSGQGLYNSKHNF